MVKRYRMKPVVIEAVQWTGANWSEIAAFWKNSEEILCFDDNFDGSMELVIQTLEGQMTAKTGDFIIRGIRGEFYPCKPDIFESTYEEVANEQP